MHAVVTNGGACQDAHKWAVDYYLRTRIPAKGQKLIREAFAI